MKKEWKEGRREQSRLYVGRMYRGRIFRGRLGWGKEDKFSSIYLLSKCLLVNEAKMFSRQLYIHEFEMQESNGSC